MPQNTHVARRCSDCDGFPAVAITTGQTSPDGSRETITATCHTCKGTGARPAARFAFAGR